MLTGAGTSMGPRPPDCSSLSAAADQRLCAHVRQVREYLEKNYAETSGNDTVKLALKALTETVEAGSKNIEVAVISRDSGAGNLTPEV